VLIADTLWTARGWGCPTSVPGGPTSPVRRGSGSRQSRTLDSLLRVYNSNRKNVDKNFYRSRWNCHHWG